ncbi:mycoredoxin [Agrococcus sp. ARC_14]|uniref:mycoredoxin n=1 Tax=Agrococcus sp. ARC_14 TaxID=2919927 RepID=UPI001F063ED5|nr:mycoredoxin [Agrococcus sp. ARC_14]MCH1883513.1 mycoredoxin [Agrococcus sp. ARC_14]
MSATTIQMYGADWCRDCRRTKAQLDGLAVDYEYIDVEQDEAAAEDAKRISGRMSIPVVVFPDGTHQVEPSNAEVEAKLQELSLV